MSLWAVLRLVIQGFLETQTDVQVEIADIWLVNYDLNSSVFLATGGGEKDRKNKNL